MRLQRRHENDVQNGSYILRSAQLTTKWQSFAGQKKAALNEPDGMESNGGIEP